MAPSTMDGSGYLVLFGGFTDSRNDETWTFGGGDYALPVELSTFKVICKMNCTELKWKTVTEVNNYGFEIERKVSGIQSSVGSQSQNMWEKIGFVQGSGNSNSTKEYSFIDETVIPGKYSYRLKQIDNNGGFSYSSEVEVNVYAIPMEFALYQNYPNPFNPSTVISYQLPVYSFVTLKVFDVLGNEVATLVNENQSAGTHEVVFQSAVGSQQLASGGYYYQLLSSYGGDSFVETKKFVLMK
ncbi:MAG: hypothetical protein Q8N83_01495 [Ignavibacteria bacterium]|nr:hypothetical protein [Ignavibacteria bacterium]